jgi:hypothetical protein
MPTIFCSQQPAPPSKSDTHDTLNPTTNHIHVNPSLAPSRPTGAISKCIIDFCFPRSLRHDITTTPLIVRDALSHTYIHITTSQTCLTSNPNSRSPKKNLQTQQHQPHRNYAQVNTTPRRPTHTHKPLVRRLIQHALQHHRRREQNRREQKHKRDPARRTFLVPPSLHLLRPSSHLTSSHRLPPRISLSTNPVPNDTNQNPSILSSAGAIGKQFNPDGAIGQIGSAVGGPFSKEGAVGSQFDASKNGIAGLVERAVDGPRNPAGSST